MRNTYQDLVNQIDPTLPTLRCPITGVTVAWQPGFDETTGYYRIALIESRRSRRIRQSIARDVNTIFIAYVEQELRLKAQRSMK
jgi:hypothetical protein